ncbi:ABC transporter ATP-binding protein [Pseudomonadota bacterium]
MMTIAIKTENLSKKYIIGHQRQGQLTTFRDVLAQKLRSLGQRIRHPLSPNQEEIMQEDLWALRDINLVIRQGEKVGIIGRNGAGKSTLLKVLSRITEPTEGRFSINGRVASLLEVGTGFHPELSGRENIFLNGAILGMSKVEIRSKFDEIVAFSETEKFLDTPVKRYSSGMYVRLAFAIAAHLEPEILIVDEVLAVGDAAFQKKCLGKMSEVSSEGRTILFVSHNTQSIRALCSRGLVLQSGLIAADGPILESIDFYNSSVADGNITAITSVGDERLRRGSGSVRFEDITVTDKFGQVKRLFEMGEEVRFGLSYQVFDNTPNLYVSIALRSGKMGEIITTMRHEVSAGSMKAGTNGSMELKIPELILRPGEYELYLWLGNKSNQPFDVVDGLLPPIVVHVEGDIDNLGFDPANSVGFFNIPSQLSENQNA